MKNFRKRWTAWVLMFSLIISAVPVNAFAYDGGAVDDQVIEIAQGGFYDLTQDLEAGLEGVWESDNEEIVVVNENGVAEGKAVGETTVRFTAEKINLGPAPEMKDEAVNVPANSDAAAPGPDAGVIAPGEEDSQLNQEPGSIDTPVVDENNSEKTDSELTGTEGTGSEVNGGEDGNTTDTPATDETGSNNEAVENDGANGGEPAVGDEGTDEGSTDSEESGTDESNTSDEGSSEATGSDEGDTSNEPSADGTDGAYLTEETDDTVVYTWTVRVYDPAVRDFANAVDAISAELDGLELNAELSAATYKAQVDALLGSLTEEQQASEEAQAAVDRFVGAAVGVLARAWNSFNEAIAALEGAEEVTEEETASLETLQLLLDSYSMELMGLFGEDVVTAKLEAIMNPVQTLAGDGTVTVTDSNGKVIYNNNSWKKNNGYSHTSGTATLTVTGNVTGRIVVSGGTLTIKGKDTKNKGVINGNGGSVITIFDGRVVLKSNVTITGGTGTEISVGGGQWAETYTAGGGVLLMKGRFEMNGGVIDNNTANKGGGVYVAGYGARFSDGSHMNPSNYTSAQFKMTGGTVSNNSTVGHNNDGNGRRGEGGGIWIGSTGWKNQEGKLQGNTITGGKIINNHCTTLYDWGGGGVYVNSSASLNIDTPRITNNTANGLGGGVSGCPDAKVALNLGDGAVIYGNHALKTYRPNRSNMWYITTNGVKTGDFLAYGDDNANFTKEKAMDFYCVNSSIVIGQKLNIDNLAYIGRVAYEKGPNKDVTVKTGETLAVKQGSLGLTAVAPGTGKEGTVEISGNTSTTHGGGIACNGDLTFGPLTEKKVESKSWAVEVKKALTNVGGSAPELKAGQFTFNLLDKDKKSTGISATNTADGMVRFVVDSDQYKKAGKYTFYVQEVSSGDSGINYDTTAKQIQVQVTTKEDTAVVGGVSITTTKSFAELVSPAKGLTITNTVKPGNLTVTKQVSNLEVANADDVFSFTVKLTAPDSKNINWQNVKLNNMAISSKDSQEKEITVTFNLKAKETTTISGIPAGVTYTVTEAGKTGYTQQGEVGNDGKVPPVTGTISAGATAQVTITNKRDTADLTFSKTVTEAVNSDTRNENDVFEIKVKLGQGNQTAAVEAGTGEYQQVGSYLADGVYTFSLKAGDKAKITGVPTGTTYTVEETAKEFYENTNAAAIKNGTVSNTEHSFVVENEYYKPQYTNISVTKEFKGGERFRPQSVTVELQGGPDSLTDKTRVLSKDNNWTADWSDLPMYPGKTGDAYQYSVKEIKVEYFAGATSYDVDEPDGNLFRVRSRINHTAAGVAEIVGGWTASYEKVTDGSFKITNLWHPADAVGEGSFKVLKVDSVSKKPISNVEFTLTHKYIPTETYTLLTDSDGVIQFSGLKPDTYILRETLVPDEYNTEANLSQEFEVKLTRTLDSVEELTPAEGASSVGKNNWSWQAAIGDKVGEIKVENNMVMGKISITKAVEDTQGYIAPADFAGKEFVFNVVGEDPRTKEVINEELTVTTSVQDGKVVSTTATTGELPYGYYTISEVTPEEQPGYTWTGVKFSGQSAAGLDYQVKIDSEHKELAITATNVYERHTGALSITKTVAGDSGETNRDWNFRIKLTAPESFMALAAEYPVVFSGVGYDPVINPDDNPVAVLPFTQEIDPDGNVSYIGNVTLKHGQTATITGLPQGTKYVVEEVEANQDYYSTKVEDATGNIADGETAAAAFTNTRNDRDIPNYDSVEVRKVWENDADHQDTRPASITVQLFDNGVLYDTQELNAANGWKYKWDRLNMKGHTWTVEEVSVPGYRSEVSGLVNGVITITNTFINPDELVVQKAWVGDTPANRPAEITVQLYNGETAYGDAIQLTATNGWTYTWTGLPIRGNWQVREVTVPDNYSQEVSGVVDGKITITNTYHQPLTVNKVWVGGNEASRPAAITVQLYNGTTPYGDAVQLTAEGGWTHTWTMLPLDGNWRVVETTVPDGYHANVSEVINGVIVVTNTYDDNNGGGDEPGGDEPETNIPNEPTPLTDLPDDDVPLATLPSADGEGENDDEEIFDEEIPLADVPTTGDDGKSGLWLALAMSSGLAGIWLHQNGRKRREETQD